MRIVLGPPGTGKTTKLLSLVESYLESGVPPDRIGYFAFTRRAAQEAIDRAIRGGTGRATVQENRRTKLAEGINQEGVAPRQADIISEKIMGSGITSSKYTLLPKEPIEGKYYYDKKGNVGQYQIRDGKPGLFEKD